MSRFSVLFLFVLVVAAGCTGQLRPPPAGRVHRDDRPIDRPRKRSSPLVVEIIDKSFPYQLKQVLDLPRAGRKLIGRPYQALNVDAFDEVPNSTWFTNRNHARPMSLAEIRRGPDCTTGPDTTGPWEVVALKSAGVTPGMTIVDARGDRYLIKFDPPDFPELPSGTEVVASRLFHAAGYNVPKNYIAYLDPEGLVPAASAVMTVGTNDQRAPLSKGPLRREDLETVLQQVNPTGRGRVRVLASRFLPGIPAGPWSYTGVRPDDPNDVYPHEHRRETRGLYVVASWLNHADMKEENTLDMYDPQARCLRHYLIDFGAAMGSNSTNPSTPRRGQANSLDVKDALTRLATLGLYVHGYERAPRTIRHPAVGYLENDLFEPDRWKPMYPMPAFENLTRRDAFWGARIVTSFTDSQIVAAVSTGEYSDPDAAAGLAGFLQERRDRIGRYFFARLNPLYRFATPDGATLQFVDLAVDRGYARADQTRYRFTVRAAGGTLLGEGRLPATALSLEPAWRAHNYIAVSLRPQRPHTRARPVLVYLRPSGDAWEVIGLRRQD